MDFEKYDAAGQINEDRLYQDAVSAIKRFGNDVCIKTETFLDVHNRSAEKPKDFFALIAAYKCQPDGYESEVEHHELQSSIFYRERISKGDNWSDCNSCCTEKKSSVIQENIYLNTGRISFNYTNPTLLKVAAGNGRRSGCTTNCRNLYFTSDTANTISINQEYISTDFDSGSIYLVYYALPTDENGDIDVPDTANGHLHTYVEANLKRRLIERLLLNGDAQGALSSMYPVIAEQEKVAIRNTVNELKMRQLTPSKMKRIQKINKINVLNYEIFTPW